MLPGSMAAQFARHRLATLWGSRLDALRLRAGSRIRRPVRCPGVQRQLLLPRIASPENVTEILTADSCADQS